MLVLNIWEFRSPVIITHKDIRYTIPFDGALHYLPDNCNSEFNGMLKIIVPYSDSPEIKYEDDQSTLETIEVNPMKSDPMKSDPMKSDPIKSKIIQVEVNSNPIVNIISKQVEEILDTKETKKLITIDDIDLNQFVGENAIYEKSDQLSDSVIDETPIDQDCEVVRVDKRPLTFIEDNSKPLKGIRLKKTVRKKYEVNERIRKDKKAIKRISKYDTLHNKKLEELEAKGL